MPGCRQVRLKGSCAPRAYGLNEVKQYEIQGS
jgi:hypothetical protein